MDKKIKVLMIIPGSDSGSSMIFARRQAAALVKQGINCECFFLASRSLNKMFFTEIIRFRKMLRSFKPDIVHSQYGTMTSFFSAFLSHSKFIVTFHGSDLNVTYRSDGFFADLFGRILSNISVLRASAIICVNRSLASRLWWRKNKVVVIPMGVDTDIFFPINRSEARGRIGWKEPDEKVIIFNGNNTKIKRLDIALAATEILKKLIPVVRLQVLDGAIDPSIVPLYLNAADCLLLCSDSEGSPMIIKEALACDLPIVSVDVGDAVERLRGVNNCRITAKEETSIAKNIAEIFSSNQRSDGKKKLIADGLTEMEVAQRIINLYASVL